MDGFNQLGLSSNCTRCTRVNQNIDHVTHKGKYKLSNQKPGNFAHELLP